MSRGQEAERETDPDGHLAPDLERWQSSAAFGSTVCSRKSLYQPIGFPAANSATRFGWNPMKRADTVGYGSTPQASSQRELGPHRLEEPCPGDHAQQCDPGSQAASMSRGQCT